MSWFSCIHQERMYKAFESMEVLMRRFQNGWVYDFMNEQNEVRKSMEKIYLCFSKCLEIENDITIKLKEKNNINENLD